MVLPRLLKILLYDLSLCFLLAPLFVDLQSELLDGGLVALDRLLESFAFLHHLNQLLAILRLFRGTSEW